MSRTRRRSYTTGLKTLRDGQLEDGESEIIDKVRAALSMTEASAMLSARKGMS